MIYASGAAGPPGYGGITEDNVGEQKPPEPETAEHRPPENPPSEQEQPLDTRAIVERPLGVPVDQTE